MTIILRGIGSEKKVSLRGVWEILRGIPHLSNVTYLLAKEGNTGIHLRLRVPRLFLYPSSLSFVIAIVLEVLIISCYHLCSYILCLSCLALVVIVALS